MKPTNQAKINLKNIKKFLQGWIRYILYKLFKQSGYLSKVSDSLGMLKIHEKEQFEWRLMTMNPECLNAGKCRICGCQTPQLQMADEACEGNCYPEMKNENDWTIYKRDNKIII